MTQIPSVPKRPSRIIIADDEPPARRRLFDLLDELQPAFPHTVVAEVDNGRAALEASNHGIRGTDELNLSGAASKPAEVKMAVTLIDQLTKPFNPKNFKDNYTDKLLKIIKAKSKGKSVPFKPLKIVHSKSQDLMDQLKASLSASKKKAS